MTIATQLPAQRVVTVITTPGKGMGGVGEQIELQ